MIKLQIPRQRSSKYIENFFKKKKLYNFIKLKRKINQNLNNTIQKNLLKPDLKDLYRLYEYVVLNKRTTILEFGSGWSSLMLNIALKDLKKKYNQKIKKLRRHNPFELFILENEKKYLNISKKRILKYEKKLGNPKIKTNFFFSEVNMVLYKEKIATEYKKIPLCNPDLIYIDGPGQHKAKKDINGINTVHKDLMPMMCDVLKFEYFFIPGTIIILDGRAANAKFLKDHFKRKWRYIRDIKNDQHVFLLKDPILGKYNKLQIEFYNKN